MFLKMVAAYVIISHLLMIWMPSSSYGLTSGPSQPEVQGFTPIGTSEAVNLATGDFMQNIPLLDVGGYPLNLSYDAGAVGMDQEASTTGLGWKINVGHMSRNMRGLPDDFKGDEVVKEFNMKPNQTVGVSLAAEEELFGLPLSEMLEQAKDAYANKKDTVFKNLELQVKFGVKRNSYKGLGLQFGVNTAFNSINTAKGDKESSLGLGLNFDSQNGMDVSANFSYSKITKGANAGDLIVTENGGNSSFNSRQGLQSLSFAGSKFNLPRINNSQSFIPQLDFPYFNFSFSFDGKTQTELFGLTPGITFRGFYSNQKLKYKSETVFAFGYMNSEQGKLNKRALLDFNREKDGAYIKNATPNLPIPVPTYDMFSAQGHGIGGAFRAYRSDWGLVHDPYIENNSGNASGGYDWGLGGGVKGGINVTFDVTKSTSGSWGSQNKLGTSFRFGGEDLKGSEPYFEKIYFKGVGEKTVELDPDFFNMIGRNEAVRPQLNKNRTGIGTAINGLVNKKGEKSYANEYVRQKRSRRNQFFQTLNASEASEFALEKKIRSYSLNGTYTSDTLTYSPIDRQADFRQGHHISEIRVTANDGRRYFYGLPAYNIEQKEVSFNASGLNNDCGTGLVKYTPGTDNDKDNNSNGRDNYYSSTQLPAYAHTYLLTGVLSSDYSDLTGDGISDDDLGTAIKFNYHRLTDSYTWRTPVQQDSASFNQGFISKKNDDRGSYVYGKREEWLIQSIESRHYIAEFHYEDRFDRKAVTDENGGNAAGNNAKQLSKITLYAKHDRKENGSNAIPIKTVHFDYEYTLCSGTPNSSSTGKLTLTKLYFTYGNSYRAKFSSYTFTYGSGVYNPSYNIKGYDRWGNYKPNDCIESPNSCSDLPNWQYPYTDQRVIPSSDTDYYNGDYPADRYADAYAKAWKLTKIRLPSGGTIEVDYEADDYAYVQDKKAMQMFEVIGAAKDSTDTPLETLYSKNKKDLMNYIFVKLTEPVQSSSEFVQKYVNNINSPSSRDSSNILYFNFHFYLDIEDDKGNSPNAASDPQERISGYVRLAETGHGIVDSVTGFVRVKSVGIADRQDAKTQVNPIVKRAWNFSRQNLSEYVYPGSDPNGTGESAIKGLLGAMGDMVNIFKGANRVLRNRHFCRWFVPEKSWVRLNSPDGMKHGGDYRVREVRLKDAWDDMTGNQADESTYGQRYTYTKVSGDDYKGTTISSGVASFEPIIGGDENPFRMPKAYYNQDVKWGNDLEFFVDGPIMEGLFPSPSIVYSQVKVESLPNEDVKRTGTGYVLHEFYTAKDFPTKIVDTGPPDEVNVVNRKSLPFKKLNLDYLTVSQGYAIYLNNMHGVAKGQKVFAEGANEPISGANYYYKTGDNGYLNNHNLQVLFPNDSIGEATIGQEIDLIVDEREQRTLSKGYSPNSNVDFLMVGLIPLPPILSFFLPSSASDTRFRSLVATKIINTYGILERAEVFDKGSYVSTENLAYDAETGEVLLTRTTNEFNDSLYSFSYPAHWAYDALGAAYQNTDAHWENVTIQDVLSSPLLTHGDELMLEEAYGEGDQYRGWVLDEDDAAAGVTAVIDRNGKVLDELTVYNSIKVLRSGHRNLQGTAMGSITTKSDPRDLVNNKLKVTPDDVLQASAIEYADIGNIFCGYGVWDTVCQCSGITEEAQDLEILLNKLITEDVWLDADVTLDGYTEYSNSSLYTLFGVASGNSAIYDATLSEGDPLGIKDTCFKRLIVVFNEKDTRGRKTTICRVVLDLDSSAYCFSYFDRLNNIRPYDSTSACDTTTLFRVDGIINSECGDIVVPITANLNTCFDAQNCWQYIGPSYSCWNPGDTINPFVRGIRGQWYPQVSYAYLTGRTQTPVSTTTDIRNDGVYSSYSSFWQWDAVDEKWEPNETGWTWTSQISKWLPYGYDIETYDALYRYSAAQYGYDLQVPIAVSANARYNQIAAINFEVAADVEPGCKAHITFDDQNGGEALDLTTNYAHSGYQSAQVDAGDYLSILHLLGDSSCTPEVDNIPYTIKPCDCAGNFSPTKNGRYVASAWVRSDEYAAGNVLDSYDDVEMEIRIDGVALTPLAEERSLIIEGWRRIELVFDIASSATDNIEIRFKNEQTTNKAYFDDFRFHPFYGSMSTSVYDPITLRLLAQGDERGYFTFYQYNLEGQLISVKRETEKGIVTLQEQRYHAPVQN